MSFVKQLALRAALTAAFLFSVFASTAIAASPAMWHLSDKDSEIWLFGTIHLLPPDLKWRSRKFDAALNAADTVYLEVDVTRWSTDDFPLYLRQIGTNANFVSLSSILGSADTQRLIDAATSVGIPPHTLDQFRPWAAFLALSRSQYIAQGFAGHAGADSVISDIASAAGKRLAYFETMEQQVEIFASLSPRMEKALLVSTLDEFEKASAHSGKMLETWMRGEEVGIDQFPEAQNDTEMAAFEDALLGKRNRAWVRQITRIMAGSGKTFIAVGAGHMPGKQGLITLLRAKGFKVKQL
ncbi:MAG: hypothetical protein GKS00_20075 [Alphaproteobacteria bacterium]|nr:hypothetical protein [Alphaproteobacteria bacterium]